MLGFILLGLSSSKTTLTTIAWIFWRQRRVVSVIPATAPCLPILTEDELEFKNESNLLKKALEFIMPMR